jgi:hypothetical protein
VYSEFCKRCSGEKSAFLNVVIKVTVFPVLLGLFVLCDKSLFTVSAAVFSKDEVSVKHKKQIGDILWINVVCKGSTLVSSFTDGHCDGRLYCDMI